MRTPIINADAPQGRAGTQYWREATCNARAQTWAAQQLATRRQEEGDSAGPRLSQRPSQLPLTTFVHPSSVHASPRAHAALHGRMAPACVFTASDQCSHACPSLQNAKPDMAGPTQQMSASAVRWGHTAGARLPLSHTPSARRAPKDGPPAPPIPRPTAPVQVSRRCPGATAAGPAHARRQSPLPAHCRHYCTALAAIAVQTCMCAHAHHASPTWPSHILAALHERVRGSCCLCINARMYVPTE